MDMQTATDLFLNAHRGVRSDDTIVWYSRKLKALVAYLGPGRSVDQVTLDELRAWRAQLKARGVRWAIIAVAGLVGFLAGISQWVIAKV